MNPVSQQELLTLLDDAELVSGGVPGIELMLARVVDIIGRALTDPGSIEVQELDAILTAARETAEYRALLQLGDPYAEARARCVDIWTRLREELLDRPGPVPNELPGSWSPGDGIRAARRGAGLTQAQLADKLEVNQTTVARWEAGVLAPNHRHRSRLADLLGGRPADYEERSA